MPLSHSQIALRSTGIGASEIGAICGFSFWKRAPDGSACGGPHSVYLAKRGLVVPSESSLASRTGDRSEKLAELTYEGERGVKLVALLDNNGDPLTMRHMDHPWALASIDRVRADSLIPVEVKFTAGLRAHYHEGRDLECCTFCDRPKRMHWRDPIAEPKGVPDDVFAQVQWQMFVSGAPRSEVARFWADWDGIQFSVYHVERSERVIEMLFQKGHDFWYNHVLAGIPPEPDASDESERCERTFAQKVLRKMQQAPNGTERHVQAFLDADAAIREAKKTEAEAGNWLRRLVGDAEGLSGPDYVITNRARKDGVRVLRVRRT